MVILTDKVGTILFIENFCIKLMESSQDCIFLELVKILISGCTCTRHIHADLFKTNISCSKLTRNAAHFNNRD